MSAFVLSEVCREVGALTVLKDVNLEIPDRQFTVLIGPSGSGKTSLLRLLNRLDDPTSGTIRYHDRLLIELPIREHRARVGFVFQTPVMFPGSVQDNLAVAAETAAVPADEITGRMNDSLLAAEVDLQLLGRDASKLSVGQQQRVSIARTLMTRPATLLLDEPTASLDPETAEKLMNTIARLSTEKGVTVVAATHRLVEAKRISGYVAMLEEGAIVQAGTTPEIFDQSNHPRLRSFLSSMV